MQYFIQNSHGLWRYVARNKIIYADIRQTR